MKSWRSLSVAALALAVGLILGTGHDAHASYLDPGTGSYLFQLAIASALGGVFTLRRAFTWWRSQLAKARQARMEEQ